MPDATIYDVAERAGVSISTVSRVLNAPDEVNEATRTRVLAAIHELGFVPKAEAAARARRGTRRIGVLAPFLTYPSIVQRLRGLAALADAAYEGVHRVRAAWDGIGKATHTPSARPGEPPTAIFTPATPRR